MSIKPSEFIGRNAKKKFIASKQFTDRIKPRQAFANQLKSLEIEINSDKKQYHVLNYYGMGGIGKSSLQKELKRTLSEEHPEIPYSFIDFANLSAHQPARMLLELVSSFSKNDFKFPHFCLAYAIYFEKTNRDLVYNEKNKIFPEGLEILTDLISQIEGLSPVGIIPGVVNKIYNLVNRKLMLEKEIRTNLEELETMEASKIEQLLPAFWAYDLRRYLCREQLPMAVVFIDTYEALWENGKNDITKFTRDAFIRELIANLPGILFTICSREFLEWGSLDSDWDEALEQHMLERLSETDAETFLKQCQISEPDIRAKMIEVSLGHPYHLDLLVDTYEEIKNLGKIPNKDMFASSRRDVLECFFKYIQTEEIAVIKIMSIPRLYTFDLFCYLLTKLPTGYPITLFDQFNKFSFINATSQNTYHVHEIMRKEILSMIDNSLFPKTNQWIAQYYSDLLCKKSITLEDKKAYTKEYIYHLKFYLSSHEYIEKIEAEFLSFFIEVQYMGESSYLCELLSDVQEYAGNEMTPALFEILTDMIMLNGDFKLAVRQIDAFLHVYSIANIACRQELLQLYVKKVKHQMVYSPIGDTLELINSIMPYIRVNETPHQYVETSYTRANMLMEKGEVSEAEKLLSDIQEIAKKYSLDDMNVRIIRKLIDCALFRNDVYHADELCKIGLDIALANNYARYGNYIKCSKAEIFRKLKLFDKASEIFQECRIEFEKLGIAPWIGHTNLGNALIELERQNYQLARLHLTGAKEIYDRHSHFWGQSHATFISLICDYSEKQTYSAQDFSELRKKCVLNGYDNLVKNLDDLAGGKIVCGNLLFL